MKEMTGKQALGRGLEALLPAPRGQEVMEVELERLAPSSNQPRRKFEEQALKELAATIKSQGVLQPLLVSPAGDGSYMLIAGERRLRIAGLSKVPVIIRKSTPQVSLEQALIENIQRKDLNPIETGAALERLQKEFNTTQEVLSERLGMERTSISQFTRLLRLPEEIKALIVEGKLSMGHGKLLLSLESRAVQIEAARLIVQGRLSVRQTEGMVKKFLFGKRTTAGAAVRKHTLEPELRALEHKLSTSLGTKVSIKAKGQKGKTGRIEIEYYSLDQLQGILEKLL
jgi:ParB family chromosome partitioning protein